MDVFCEIPCLTELSTKLSGLAIQKKWLKNADKRYLGQYLQKFIAFNSKHFNFLGVTPILFGTDQNTSLAFRSTEYIGTIPLRSSDTGKQIGDFVVSPRFIGRHRYQDYIKILDLLGTEINPEVIDSIPLVSGNNFRPPLYLEAIKFITSLENLVKYHWRKFDNIKKIENKPNGQIKWNEYFQNEYKVEKRLKFPATKNILSELHIEYSQVRYVFDICKSELLSNNTPLRVKFFLNRRLNFLEEKLYLHKPIETNSIQIKLSDNPVIKNCKLSANNILEFNFFQSTAWRVNFSDVFEKFVQYIFMGISKTIGGKVLSNYKFYSKHFLYFSWALKNLEPDVIYQKGNLLVFIDAKYKANLYNKFNSNETLKNDHRHDLHQILSYTSFSSTQRKYCCLCYPSDSIETKKIIYKNSINDISNTIFIIGIPLRIEEIKNIKSQVISILHFIEKDINLTLGQI
ncbi:MAG: hypothetical protein OEZ22_13190 [Spirochaetia bacterium]|nr:hypothetical protein [Spirochaetia bacterium]